MKKQSFVEKVLAFVKGGDDAKLTRFSGKLEKYYTNQIKMRQDKIDSLTDRIDDANEALEETIVNVDLDAVNKTESAESYCVIYSRKVAEAKAKVDNLTEEVEQLEKEITELQALRDLVFGKDSE